MPENIEAPEAPVVETPEAPVAEPIIENRRAAIESEVITENNTFAEPTVLPDESPKEELKPEILDKDKKIKDNVQKRIDKVIAQKKSVEEENAELKAELEKLKASPKVPEVTPESKPEVKDNTPPTIAQVTAYIKKMREEGKVEEEVAAFNYLVDLKKEQAIKEVEDKQTKAQKESESVKSRQLNQWIGLQKDYETSDPNDDMNIANQQGELYQTALGYYNNPNLHAGKYNDPDVINGFRRAVADAYRDIQQERTPKGNEIIPKKANPRQVLANPESDSPEEPSQGASNSLSDAQKVREEILNRKKNRFLR